MKIRQTHTFKGDVMGVKLITKRNHEPEFILIYRDDECWLPMTDPINCEYLNDLIQQLLKARASIYASGEKP
jgi:hypothetical protein